MKKKTVVELTCMDIYKELPKDEGTDSWIDESHLTKLWYRINAAIIKSSCWLW